MKSPQESDSLRPPPELIRGHLKRLLADPRFIRSERLSRLLCYTVEKSLAGESEQLKEYVIALEVFGRPSSYDPSVDSLVRVEVGRLRSKLVDYYGSSGRDDPIHIEFPKGTYAPRFVNRAPAESDVGTPPARKRRSIAPWTIGGLVIIGFAAVFFMSRGVQTGKQQPSIAVLPFSSFTSDPETDAFAGGLTEDVTNALSHSGDWRVTSSASTHAFRTRPDSVVSIGRQLHVDGVLVGTVRKEANHLRITAQLVNPIDGYYRWAETYDRDSTRRLALQTELAGLIAHALSNQKVDRSVLQSDDSPAMREVRTDCRRARELIDQNIEDHLVMRPSGPNIGHSLANLMTAIQTFEHAITLDPRYVPAHAGLARAYSLAADYDERMAEKANGAALRGLSVDDRIPEAHFVLAYGKFLREWDLRGADREWKRTLELDPRDVTASRLYADCSALIGDWPSGFTALRRAQQLVPDSPVIALQVGIMLYHARRFDEMLAHAQSLQRQYPDVPQVHWLIGLALEQRGRYRDAAREFEACLRQSPGDIRATPALGHVYGLLGRRTDAMRVIETSRDLATKGGLGPTGIGLVYLGLGDISSSFQWWEKAYEVREPALLYITLDPRFDPIRANPRFSALLRKLSF